MNEILKIGGLAVRARLLRSDSWQVEAVQSANQVSFSVSRSTHGEVHEINQRTVREHFLSIRTPEHGLAFFRKFGPFQRRNPEGDDSRSERAINLQFAVLQNYQELYREFIASPIPGCFDGMSVDLNSPDASRGMGRLLLIAAHPVPTFTVRMGYVRPRERKHPSPYLEQIASDVENAVFNSIYIDKMAGLRGALCETCGKPILSKSDKPRRFCGDRCSASKRQVLWRAERKKEKQPEGGDNAKA